MDRIRTQRKAILDGPSILKADRPHTTSSVGADGNILPIVERHTDSMEAKAVAPLESLVILVHPAPVWLLSRNLSFFQKDAVRFRFLCESLSIRNVCPPCSRPMSPSSPRPRTAPRPPSSGRADDNRPTADQETCCLERNGCDDSAEKQTKISVELKIREAVNSHGLVSERTSSPRCPELTMSRLQPIVPPARVSSARISSPQRLSRPLSGKVGNASMDGRLRRHIWSADRVLRWCSNFADDETDIGDGSIPERARSSNGRSRQGTELGKAETTACSRLELILRAQYESVFGGGVIGDDFWNGLIGEDVSELPSPLPKPPVPPVSNIKDVLQACKRQQVVQFQTRRDEVLESARMAQQVRLEEVKSKVQEARGDEARVIHTVNDYKAKKLRTAKAMEMIKQSELRLAKEENAIQKRLDTAGAVSKTQRDRRRKRKALNAKRNILQVGTVFNAMNRHAMRNATRAHKQTMVEDRRAQVQSARANHDFTESVPLIPEEMSLDGSKSARDRDREWGPKSPPYTPRKYIHQLMARDRAAQDATNRMTVAKEALAPSQVNHLKSKQVPSLFNSAFNSLADYANSQAVTALCPEESKGSLQPIDGSQALCEEEHSSEELPLEGSSHAISTKKDISITARINMIEYGSIGGRSVEGSAIDLGSLPSTPAKPRERTKLSNSRVREQMVKSRISTTNVSSKTPRRL